MGINIPLLVLCRCLTGRMHFALLAACLDFDHVLIQTSRKKTSSCEKEYFWSIVWGQSLSTPVAVLNISLDSALHTWSALFHRNITSKFSLADIHQLYKEKRHKLLEAVSLGHGHYFPQHPLALHGDSGPSERRPVLPHGYRTCDKLGSRPGSVAFPLAVMRKSLRKIT